MEAQPGLVRDQDNAVDDRATCGDRADLTVKMEHSSAASDCEGDRTGAICGDRADLTIKMEHSSAASDCEDDRTASAQRVNLPVITEHYAEPFHKVAESQGSIPDSFCEGGSLPGGGGVLGKVAVKQEPADWVADEAACETDDAEKERCSGNLGPRGVRDSHGENGTNCGSQQGRSCWGLKVNLKNFSMTGKKIKTEPLDLPGNTLCQNSGADVVGANRKETVDSSGNAVDENAAVKTKLDCNNGGVDDNNEDNDDDNKMELPPIHFQPDDSDLKNAPSGQCCVSGYCSEVLGSGAECGNHVEKEHWKQSVKCAILSQQAGSESQQDSGRHSGAQSAPKQGSRSDSKRKTTAEQGKNKCVECGKEFKKFKYIRSHMRSHCDVKPFACDQCPSAFVRSSDLRRHKKTHTGEKAFKCQLCDSSFADSSKLKIHMRIHTGEKPYIRWRQTRAVTANNTG